MRLGIIADDLTGAMDTGLQFSKQGLETLVSMSWQEMPDAQVLVVDTDSRAVGASEARHRLEVVARMLEGRTLYKKVDSTMRGNVGFELRALADLLHPRCIVVAPAFPQGGRTVLDGHLRVNGNVLETTSFAHDPRWPMRQSHLPTLLMQQWGREVGHIGIDVLNRGADETIAALQACGESLVVVDAVGQEHLHTLARALVTLGAGWIPCGSAGLAEEWARLVDVRRQVPSVAPLPGGGPVLVVSGSRHEVTLSQLRYACSMRKLERVDLESERCYDAEREIERLTDACVQSLAKGRDVILTASFSKLLAGAGAIVTRVLSGTVMRVASCQHLGGLFLTGGDSAVACCHALEVKAIRITFEVQAGIPGGMLVGGPWDRLWVVTKAGGFGDESAILDSLDYMHGTASRTSR